MRIRTRNISITRPRFAEDLLQDSARNTTRIYLIIESYPIFAVFPLSFFYYYFTISNPLINY